MRASRRSRRRGHSEEATGHDRWLVSYADFVTLLFALFVVLFATSYRDNISIRKLSRAIHVGFQKLGAFSAEASHGPEAYPVLGPETPVDANPANVPKPLGSNATGIDIGELRKQLQIAIGHEIQNHEIDMHVTPEGFVISLKDLGFFNSGEATLRAGGADKIERIARVLAQHNLDVRIEGHSDDQPIHTPEFRSNWELSSARAMAVLMLLANDQTVNPSKLSVAAYGQYRPIADNATAEGRRLNRRVDLVVVAPVTTPLSSK
ncbi:MAG TPA: OmpA family protein [Acidobacteriaceae bacterium]|jgi:chemotaxis protein MotB|nr:OmpA family protein [Acidobacteriaceae bacterium]